MSDQNKYMLAIIRHEKAKQAVDSLTRDIGFAISRCPVTVKSNDPLISNSERDQLFDEGTGKTKTHLWHAFKHREPSSCGWGEVGLCEDGISDALSEGSEFECEHCYHAYRMIVARKDVRNELGRARLAIRSLGRAALKGESSK
jgi:hypothetical protein